MNFAAVIATLSQRLDDERIRYALIGGFAMALRGVQRATMDLDFILMLDDLPLADRLLLDLGYRREFRSDNVSHYLNPDDAWGRIDILHAFRGPSLGMLRRADRLPVGPDLTLPVAKIEDIIGLKIQAMANDPARALTDWNDIGLLLGAAREQKLRPDCDLREDYLRIFDLGPKMDELKSIYGETK